MIEITFNIRAFVYGKDNRVFVRVRWNKDNEVTFVTGMYADKSKWDLMTHRALKSTVHEIKGRKYPAYKINERIDEFYDEIRRVFAIYGMNNSVPTPSELKLMVNKELGRIEEVTESEKPKRVSLKDLLNRFLKEEGNAKNWDDDCKEKYTQAYQHITAAVPSPLIACISSETGMLKMAIRIVPSTSNTLCSNAS